MIHHTIFHTRLTFHNWDVPSCLHSCSKFGFELSSHVGGLSNQVQRLQKKKRLVKHKVSVLCRETFLYSIVSGTFTCTRESSRKVEES